MSCSEHGAQKSKEIRRRQKQKIISTGEQIIGRPVQKNQISTLHLLAAMFGAGHQKTREGTGGKQKNERREKKGGGEERGRGEKEERRGVGGEKEEAEGDERKKRDEELEERRKK